MRKDDIHISVIPAKAGIQRVYQREARFVVFADSRTDCSVWFPASAGTTGRDLVKP